MNRKSWIFLLAASLILTLVSVPHAAEKLKFSTSSHFYGPDSGFFTAREKGFYQKAGFDVEIVRGFGSGNTIKYVSAKTVDFGFADTASLVGGRARGSKAKEVAMVFGKAPHGVYFFKKSGIRGPKDLEGRVIGASQRSGSYRGFGAFAKLAKIDQAKVKFQFMDFPSILPSLLAGKVDAGCFYVTGLPVIMSKTKGANKAIGVLLYRDSGFNIYSNGVIAHDDDIMKKPDRVRRFVKATLQGIAYGIDHPGETVKHFVQHNPGSSQELVKGQWKVTMSLLSTPEAKKNGVGYMSEEKMKTTRDLMARLMKLKTEVKLADLYTNQFNPKIFPKSW
jgi:NitT/TauT family transport system substrate-binding protein